MPCELVFGHFDQLLELRILHKVVPVLPCVLKPIQREGEHVDRDLEYRSTCDRQDARDVIEIDSLELPTC